MKKKFAALLVFAAVAAFVSGCAMFKDYGYARPYAFQSPKMMKHDFTASNKSKNYFRAKYDFCLTNTADASHLAEAKLERDAILSELMLMIDGAHGEFERNSRALKSTSDFVADLAVLSLNGAGTVTGGAATKAVLSAIAGGVTGTKLAVSKDLLADQAMEAIQAQMRANMQNRKAAIITSMTNSVDKYPLELGLDDVANYYYDGTVARALQNMVQSAKQSESDANDAVQSAINAPSDTGNKSK